MNRTYVMQCGVLFLLWGIVPISSSAFQPGNARPARPVQRRQEARPDGQQVFDALFQELDRMVPGEFQDDSKQKKALEDAVTAFQLKNIKRVLRIFEEQAVLDKNFPPPHLMLAALSYAVRDNQSGLALLEQAAIERPDYPGIYSALGRLALNQGRFTDALALYEKCERTIAASDLDDSVKQFFHGQCLDGMAQIALRQKRYDDAERLLEEQRKLSPESQEVLARSAELEFKQNHIKKAQAYLSLLREKNPNARPTESILASWYSRMGKEDEAAVWYEAAAEAYPEDANVQLEYANWAINHEQFSSASQAISKAEKINGENTISRSLKGKIAFAQLSYGIAENHFEAVAKQQPQNLEMINMWTLSMIESRDPEKQKKARELAIRSFRALPNNLVVQATLGYAELKLGNKSQAKSILIPVAKAVPDSPEINYFLGSLFAETGEKDQAKLILESALKHKGLFLYRTAARKLLSQLNAPSAPLPSPDP